jgi:hypothetical protein
MKNFELNFRDVIHSFDTLVPLLDDEKRVPFVRIDNLFQIVVPRAAMFVEDFKSVFKSKNHDNTIVTLEDFNVYEIINTDKPNHIHIYSNSKRRFSGIDVFVNCGEKPSVARVLDGYSGFVYSDYEFLSDFLPFDVTMKGHKMWYNIILSMHWAVSFSIATFNLLYALYNLDSCKVEGELGSDVEPVLEYVNRVSNRVKNMGRDFLEAIDNLRLLGNLLW